MNRKQLNLLLALSDAPVPSIARRMIKRFLGTPDESLIKQGFLLSSGCDRYLACDGRFINVYPDSDPGKVKYISDCGRWIKISVKEVERMHLNFSLFFDWIMRAFSVNQHYRVQPLIDDVFWSLGEFRLGKHLVSLNFACRVEDINNTKNFIDELRKQPQKNTLVLVPDEINLYVELPPHVALLPFSKVLSRRNDKVIIDFDILDAEFNDKFLSDTKRRGNTFRHSEDCRVVEWCGTRYTLAKRQAIIVNTLLKAGGRVHNDDIQRKLNIPEKLHRIMRNKVNGEWQTSPLWNTLVKSDRNGFYYLNL